MYDPSSFLRMFSLLLKELNFDFYLMSLGKSKVKIYCIDKGLSQSPVDLFHRWLFFIDSQSLTEEIQQLNISFSLPTVGAKCKSAQTQTTRILQKCQCEMNSLLEDSTDHCSYYVWLLWRLLRDHYSCRCTV